MKKFLLILPLLATLLSCIKNNPNPAWLEINAWTLEANSILNSTEGALTSNFTDAWVYVNGNLIGTFELPVKVPVIAEGSAVITIFPAILNNGISATKKIYPFVEKYELSTTLTPNGKIEIDPVTRYKSNLKFWINDFESPDIGFTSDPNTSMVDMIAESDPQYVQWGSSYGIIKLSTEDTYYAGYTTLSKALPKGQDVYLEIDYRNQNDLVTGVIELGPQNIQNHPNIQLNDQQIGCEVWKKIYIDLREIVSGTPQGESYKISLEATLEAGGIPRNILLDNVKVVYF